MISEKSNRGLLSLFTPPYAPFRHTAISQKLFALTLGVLCLQLSFSFHAMNIYSSRFPIKALLHWHSFREDSLLANFPRYPLRPYLCFSVLRPASSRLFRDFHSKRHVMPSRQKSPHQKISSTEK